MMAWNRLKTRTSGVLQGGLALLLAATTAMAGAQQTLQLSANPANGGTVQAVPVGDIDETTYTTLTVVTLSATPNNGFEFDFWGGNVDGTSNTTTQVVMDRNRVVQGNFVPVTAGSGARQFAVVAGAVPATGGSVSLSPAPVAGRVDQYEAGSNVTLTANPAGGFAFREWYGTGITAANKNQNPLGLTVNDNVRVWAAFRSTTGGDNYEPNNRFQDAQPIFLSNSGQTDVLNLTMAANDEDWYLLTLPQLVHVRIEMIFEHNQGNLQMQLWDRRGSVGEAGLGNTVGEGFASTPSRSFEVMTYTNVTAPDRLWLRVFGEGGVANPAYSLSFITQNIDDVFDIAAPNNGPCETVPTINLNQTYEDLVLRDEDWYRVVLPQGTTTISVEATHAIFSGDVNFMVLSDPSPCGFGQILRGGFSTDTSKPSELETGIDVTGQSSVLIRVFGANFFSRNQYDLRVSTP